MMTKIDKYLDGKVMIHQPAKGYRAGIDAVLLSVSVHPEKGQRVLDVGAGVGVVTLCMAYHNPGVEIIGLEIQPHLAELNKSNISLNHKEQDVKILTGSLFNLPEGLEPNSFDHVVTNPPYFDFGSKALNEDETKSLSRHVMDGDLQSWLEASLRMIKPRGYLTLVHRADQLDQILSILKKKTGGIKIFPLWPGIGQSAKLVIIQARKAVKSECQLLAGMVLHQKDKKYTPEADAIFRGLGTITL